MTGRPPGANPSGMSAQNLSVDSPEALIEALARDGRAAQRRLASMSDAQKAEAGEFLQALDDHDDVHRVWAAIK